MKIFMIGAILFLIGYSGLLIQMNNSANELNKDYLALLDEATDCEDLDGTFNFSTNSCDWGW